MTYSPQAFEVETVTGAYVDVARPRPETITLEAVAHGLAHTCRYGGQTSRFYSVAEHAVHVANLLEHGMGHPEFAFTGLHHDDAEAFLGDLPRPVKLLVGHPYKLAETRMEQVIGAALDVPLSGAPMLEPVKRADDFMLALEAQALLLSKGEGWAYPLPDLDEVPAAARPHIAGLAPFEAKQAWLDAHAELAARDQARREALRG